MWKIKTRNSNIVGMDQSVEVCLLWFSGSYVPEKKWTMNTWMMIKTETVYSEEACTEQGESQSSNELSYKSSDPLWAGSRICTFHMSWSYTELWVGKGFQSSSNWFLRYVDVYIYFFILLASHTKRKSINLKLEF